MWSGTTVQGSLPIPQQYQVAAINWWRVRRRPSGHSILSSIYPFVEFLVVAHIEMER